MREIIDEQHVSLSWRVDRRVWAWRENAWLGSCWLLVDEALRHVVYMGLSEVEDLSPSPFLLNDFLIPASCCRFLVYENE